MVCGFMRNSFGSAPHTDGDDVVALYQFRRLLYRDAHFCGLWVRKSNMNRNPFLCVLVVRRSFCRAPADAGGGPNIADARGDHGHQRAIFDLSLLNAERG